MIKDIVKTQSIVSLRKGKVFINDSLKDNFMKYPEMNNILSIENGNLKIYNKQ